MKTIWDLWLCCLWAWYAGEEDVIEVRAGLANVAFEFSGVWSLEWWCCYFDGPGEK